VTNFLLLSILYCLNGYLFSFAAVIVFVKFIHDNSLCKFDIG